MELFKKCSKCKQTLPIDNFWKNKTSNDGYQSYCKSCMKIRTANYQKTHPDKMKEYSKKSWWKHREEKINGDRIRMDNRQVFLDSLKTPCIKCGEKRPWVIQFHHKDNSQKSFGIGNWANYHKSKNDVINEVKKCVCLCANCHKEFHYLYGINPLKPIECLNDYLKRGDINGTLPRVSSNK